ncbi:neuropeptide Y receptor type 1-like [Homarus americanus]|uniref:neuropeptide Y receptor type 1-like n=1 Tax=Homarus americanus TaxID=6706 RepID=UPI001C47D75E|nr:neuropeptide Y receptor type 1-like [Homarus americanus]
MVGLKPDLQDLPDKLLGQIIHNLQNLPNETVDFSQPHLRQSLLGIYPLFLALYGSLAVAGTAMNVAMVSYIVRRRLYRDPTSAYLMNLGVCNVMMSVVLLPLSLTVLLLQNWTFGSFLCYFIPMLQDAPLHATMGTLVMVALDRYRLVSWPHKPRLPPFLAVLTTWLLALCVVLPYAVYMKYIDLQFKGVGICAINMDDDISEYIRVLFITLFAVPLGVITFLHVRVSVVLRGLDPAASVSLPTRRESRSQDSQQEVWSLHDNRFFPSTMMTEMDSRDGFHYHDAAAVHQLSSSFYTPTPTTTSTTTAPPHTPTRSSSSRGARAGEAEMIVLAERRTQRYLVTIVTTFALCLSPLMILRLVKNMVLETTENSGHFDITFITFVWVAFLPTLTTPVFYAAWKMPRRLDKDRAE